MRKEDFNLDELLDRVNARPAEETEEVPEPGSEGNPWIGVERVQRGQKRFYAFSGAERRRLIRAEKRYAAKRAKTGERAYNRQQRQREFDAGTVRMQMRILQGDVQVTDAMRANLTAHILRQTRLNERAADEPQRKEAADARREARLNLRRLARVAEGKGRHADLIAAGLR